MSFFKDFKSDINQAMNELMPDGNEVFEEEVPKTKKKKSMNPLSKNLNNAGSKKNNIPDSNLPEFDDIAPEDMLDQINDLLDNELYNDGKNSDLLLDDDLEVNTMDMSVDDLLSQLSEKQANKTSSNNDDLSDESLDSLLNSIADGDFDGSTIEPQEPEEERDTVINDELNASIMDDIMADEKEAQPDDEEVPVEEEASSEDELDELITDDNSEAFHEAQDVADIDNVPDELSQIDSDNEQEADQLISDKVPETVEQTNIEEDSDADIQSMLDNESEAVDHANLEDETDFADQTVSENVQEDIESEDAADTADVSEDVEDNIVTDNTNIIENKPDNTDQSDIEMADYTAGESVVEEKVEDIEPAIDAASDIKEEKAVDDKDVISINQTEAKSTKQTSDKKKTDKPFNLEGADEETTYITKGTNIKGDIETDSSIDVIGSVDGNIISKGKVVVGGTVNGNITAAELYANGARIEGDVKSLGSVKVGVGSMIIGGIEGESAVIAGAVNGEIDVKGPVIVDSTAVIMGNIKSRSVQINNGAVIEGFCSQSYSDIDVKSFFA